MDWILTRRTPVSNLLHLSFFISLYCKISMFSVNAKKYEDTFRQCPEAVSLGATPVSDFITSGHIHWFSSIHHISTCISIYLTFGIWLNSHGKISMYRSVLDISIDSWQESVYLLGRPSHNLHHLQTYPFKPSQ